jgi:hypothetical protein
MTIVKYDCKKNVRMKKKMFEKKDNKRNTMYCKGKGRVHLLYIKPMHC